MITLFVRILPYLTLLMPSSLLKCFDSYMSHSITVFPDGSFIRDLCLMRDDYSVFNNYAITKEELVFLINHLCTS